MSLANPIGRVVATERDPTTTGRVRFWLTSDVHLKPFDFVRIVSPEDATRDTGYFYAIIHEIFQVSDEPSPLSGYISADFGKSTIAPRVSRVVTTYADAEVVYNSKDIEMPIPHGAPVHWPQEAEVRQALGIDDYKSSTPAGFITMSGPEASLLTLHVDVDADYLIGPEGAHLNISGVSGLATKTSYAMFLLSAIQQKQNEGAWDRKEGASTSFLILNVKGSDLLRLHERAPDLTDQTILDWEKCGLVAEPLKNVTYFYPFSDASSGANAQTKLEPKLVDRNVNEGIAFRYHYDIADVLRHLHLIFEDIDDARDTLVSCASYCMAEINEDSTWSRFLKQVKGWADKAPEKSIPVVSWRRFYRLLSQRTKNAIFDEGSLNAEELNQKPLSEILLHLSPGNVVVVDIAPLPDYLQSFVVGHIIQLIRGAKTGDTDEITDEETEEFEDIETVILFADELNKFAPRHGQGRTITRHLREISERGRSEGIILFGAEQFRTGVDDRVTGNCGTQVFGRTTAIEANKDPEIKELPGKQSKRVPYLRKGELMVNHTRFSSGTLKLKFPRNAYHQG